LIGKFTGCRYDRPVVRLGPSGLRWHTKKITDLREDSKGNITFLRKRKAGTEKKLPGDKVPLNSLTVLKNHLPEKKVILYLKKG